MNKRLIPIAGVVTAGVLFFGAVSAFAQDATNPQQTLVQKIAQRFNLNENDVQAVFDENRQVKHVQMKAHFEEKLNQAVKDGKLTEEQKQAVLKKHEELQAKFEANKEDFKDMTPEERQNVMESQKKELEDWAKQNNIDLDSFFGFKIHMRGMKGHFGTN